jgi:two-component system chemotaxis response regulator CheY
MAGTILIVDDSVTVRSMVRQALRDTAHQILEAANGVAAMALLESAHADLLITDLLMPEMDGLTLARGLRADPRHHDLTILVLTTEGDADMKEQGRRAGVAGWLTKPFRPEVLRQTVATLLERPA